MTEQLKNIMWMSEEVDFALGSEVKNDAVNMIQTFLESAAAPELRHWLYQA